MSIIYSFIVIIASAFFFHFADARTNCDLQPKPALGCPPGYSVMCISAGGDHWGCGRETNGQIVEWMPPSGASEQAPPSAQEQAPPPPTEPADTSLNQQYQPPGSPINSESSVPPSPEPAPLEAPSPQQIAGASTPVYIVPLAAALAFFAWLGWWQWMKRKKKAALPAEKIGGQTVCETCGGSGKIKKKRRRSEPCGHCKETGKDICHYCGGTGRYGVGLVVPQTQEEVDSFMKCDYCEGSGFKNPVLPCCMCKGKRKIEFEESYDATCPDCKGTGHRP